MTTLEKYEQLLPDVATIRELRLDVEVTVRLNFWAVQGMEWGRLTTEKAFLQNWYVNTRYYSYDAAAVRIRPGKYTVTHIKSFPQDWLFRTEWIGEGPKAKTNVLHIPGQGMMLRFGCYEVLCISTLCNNFIKVAVRDELRVHTRMCRSCEKRWAALTTSSEK